MLEKTEPIVPAGELLRLDPRTGALTAREYSVAVIGGPDVGREAKLEGPAVIGTDPSCLIPLTDTTVSRRHVELVPRPDGVAVRDLGSTNGVHVGGARVSDAIVEGEAVITVGRTRLRVAFTDIGLALSAETSRFGDLRGASPAMRDLFALLTRIAPTSSSVVILGETGTGKDVIARTLHATSSRSAGPYVVFDCAAVPANLIESELFGHAKGAFTGAVANRAGAFEEANGGTIFLDEIGELPLEMQPRLLRVLETGTIKRVGETGYRRVDVRVLAATHRDLEAAVAEGRFRSDLFYRLSVMLVRVPALRDRLDDIPLIARGFAEELGRSLADIPESALASFRARAWPGNVRELRNEIERVLLLPEQNEAPPASNRPPTGSGPVSAALEARRIRIVEALARHAGNQKLAAQDLGISRRTLLYWLDAHGISRPRKGTT